MVEELLRYDTSVQRTGRVTFEPFPVGGKEIPPET
jgi:cytochrome P450